MNREELHKLLDKAIDQQNWVSETWDPYLRCSDEEKEQFVLMLNLIGKLAPKSLGCIDMRFEKCSPYRSFSVSDKLLGHDETFMDVIVQMALGKEKCSS